MTIDPEFNKKLNGLLDNALKRFEEAESSVTRGDTFSMDAFINDFEDEFPRDPDDPGLGSYPTYSDEALRAARDQPYGKDRGNRPKVHELNQPPLARTRGWRILDLYPDREKKDEFYRMAGTPSELRLALQVTRHVQEIITSALGSDINFEDWFRNWQDGFPNYTERTNTEYNLQTNYPLNDQTITDSETGESITIPRWRSPENRPTYTEWKGTTGSNIEASRVIEYFPNRSVPTKSFVFTGSDSQIIQQILQYHATPDIEAVGGGDEGFQYETPLMAQHPQITLYFSAGKSLPGFEKPTRTRISFRLKDKIELAEYAFSGETVLTQSDVDQLTQKIKARYANATYKLERGDKVCSYTNKPQGYRVWNPFRDRAEGVRIYTDLLELRGFILDPDKVVETSSPRRASTIPDKQVTVLGKTSTIRVGYKRESLGFTHATIHLPLSRRRETLLVNPVVSRILEIV